MKTRKLLLVLLAEFILSSQIVAAQITSAGAVVLVSSTSENRFDFDRYLKLYLDYFDVPCIVIDVASQEIPKDFENAALVILGHEGVLGSMKSKDQARIKKYLYSGGGVFSFDMATEADQSKQLLSRILKFKTDEPIVLEPNSLIRCEEPNHYITAYKVDRPDLKTVEPAYKVDYPTDLTIPNVIRISNDVKTLMSLANSPLVVIGNYGLGKVVQWTTYRWLDANVLGFYHGLDDIVWRSLVWAARKPFVFQGNIPLVSMRIDDCYGPWDDFSYIEVINKYGIIPHISFFMDAMSSSAAKKLGEYTRKGKAEAFIHSRGVGETNFMYYDFDVHDFSMGKLLSEEKVKQNFDDLDAFHKTYGIKYARTVIPHWGAIGENVLPYLRKMGVEFISRARTLPYAGDYHFWPYQLYQRAGYFEKGKTFGSYASGNFIYHPSVVIDFEDKDPSFFTVASYTPSMKVDWLRVSRAPGYEGTRKVEGMIIDGINMLRHHLDSMGPAYFFTHEVNIGTLEDRNKGLDRALAGVIENLKKVHKIIPCGLDYLKHYNKNIRTADLEEAYYDPIQKQLTVHWNGFADLPTKFHVFIETDGKIVDTLHDLSEFRGPTAVSIHF